MKRIVLPALLLALLATACGSDGAVTIEDPWTRPVPDASPNAAFFMTIRNATDADDRLVEASSPACGTIEFHISSMQDGVMSMSEVPGGEILLPAETDVVLEPGGLHLMCIGKTTPMVAGESHELSLQTAAGTEFQLEVVVEER